jgi:tetratricopeptide (TPR) repeat protein
MELNRRQRRAQARTASTQQRTTPALSGILETGLRHHQAGHLAAARASYVHALKLQPRQADALHLLGLVAHQLGQHAVALETIGRAIEIEPNVALYRSSLGNALKALDHMDEAARAYADAIRLEPGFAEAQYNLGTVLTASGRTDDALAAYTAAISLKPDFAEAHAALGTGLLELGRLDEALAAYQRAIGCKPDYAEALANLGKTLQGLGRLDEALAAYAAAIRVGPDSAEAHSNRGNTLRALGRLDDAAAAHSTAIRLRPDFPEAHYNLGNTLTALGRRDEAIGAYNQAIHIRPDFVEAHVNLGMELLLSGDFARGWEEYEWRLLGASRHRASRPFSQPRWLGEPLNGRRILLHAEQGLGDTIQFCRYAPLVAAARGGRVILEAPRPLLRLLSGLRGVTQLVAAGDPIPAFDVQCSLMSLPLAFRTRLDTIPAQIPYLTTSPDKAAYWRDRLGPRARRRIGLVWSGGFRADQPELHAVNERRNIPLRVIAQLNQPDIDFVSLQKGEPAESELVALKDEVWPGGSLINAAPDLDDFDDTAGLIAALDLVISVDTSTAHLAAAMGKPVWLLNRFDSCWRWLEHREDSPWYPTLRLFRQTTPGDWQGVIERVAAELQAMS